MSRGSFIDWNVVTLVRYLSLRNLAFSPGAYVTLSLGLIVMLLMVNSTLGAVRTGYVTVLSEPFLTPLVFFCLLDGLFMAMVAGVSMARERELGTLETLFYGPVSHRDYLLGKHLASMAAYTVTLIAFLVTCAVLGLVTHLAVSPLLLAIAGLSVATAVGLIGIGLLVASVMRTMRGTFLLFAGLLLVVLALELGQAALTTLVSSRSFIGLVVLRDTVALLNGAVTWVSPASYLLSGADAAMRGDWPGWIGYVAAAMLYGGITLCLSTVLLRRSGITR